MVMWYDFHIVPNTITEVDYIDRLMKDYSVACLLEAFILFAPHKTYCALLYGTGVSPGPTVRYWCIPRPYCTVLVYPPALLIHVILTDSVRQNLQPRRVSPRLGVA